MPPEPVIDPAVTTTPASTPAPTTPPPPVAGAIPLPVVASPSTEPPAAIVPAPGAVPAPPVATPPVAPETYDLKLPEKAVLDATAVERSAAFAKAHGLTQEAAQQTLEHTNAEVTAFVTAQQAAFSKMGDAWIDVVKADPELGGAHFEETLRCSKLAIDRFARPSFKQALNDTKFGNHPDMVAFCRDVGKAMANDGLVRPTGTVQAPLTTGDRMNDMAARLYGGPPPEK